MVNGKSVTALIDSGASHNFISARLAQGYDKAPQRAVLADPSAHLDIVGRATRGFSIQGKGSFREDFLVAPRLMYDAVLGEPWLRREAVILDFQRGCLHVGSNARHTFFWDRHMQHLQAPADDPVNLANGFPEKYQGQLRDMTREFRQVFSGDTGTTTGTTTHRLQLHPQAKPFRCAPYRYPAHKKETIAKEVERMLQEGIIEPSTSN